MSCGDENRPGAGDSHSIDADLARWNAVWHSVARYSVYHSGWYPRKFKTVIEEHLLHSEAKQKAEALNNSRSEKGFGAPGYSIQLENDEEATAAIRDANIWYNSLRTTSTAIGGSEEIAS